MQISDSVQPKQFSDFFFLLIFLNKLDIRNIFILKQKGYQL